MLRLTSLRVRERHCAQEQAAGQERQQHPLQQQQAKNERLAAMRQRRKLEAVRAAQQQGGLCYDRASVERLMRWHQTKTAIFSALSIQLRYHHVALWAADRERGDTMRRSELCSTKQGCVLTELA